MKDEVFSEGHQGEGHQGQFRLLVAHTYFEPNSRVTRLGEYLPIGRLLNLGSFFKLRK
jgi:hypothetical protein